MHQTYEQSTYTKLRSIIVVRVGVAESRYEFISRRGAKAQRIRVLKLFSRPYLLLITYYLLLARSTILLAYLLDVLEDADVHKNFRNCSRFFTKAGEGLLT